jgi:acetoin utilization protein AcuB
VSDVKVRDILQAREIATVAPDERVGLAVQVMLWSGIRHLPVVRGHEVVGVLSERDVFRRGTEVGARAARAESVSRAMATPAITIDADKPLVAAAWLMTARRLGCLPVLDGAKLVGIVTTTDLVRHQFEEELHSAENREAPPP